MRTIFFAVVVLFSQQSISAECKGSARLKAIPPQLGFIELTKVHFYPCLDESLSCFDAMISNPNIPHQNLSAMMRWRSINSTTLQLHVVKSNFLTVGSSGISKYRVTDNTRELLFQNDKGFEAWFSFKCE